MQSCVEPSKGGCRKSARRLARFWESEVCESGTNQAASPICGSKQQGRARGRRVAFHCCRLHLAKHWAEPNAAKNPHPKSLTLSPQDFHHKAAQILADPPMPDDVSLSSPPQKSRMRDWLGSRRHLFSLLLRTLSLSSCLHITPASDLSRPFSPSLGKTCPEPIGILINHTTSSRHILVDRLPHWGKAPSWS